MITIRYFSSVARVATYQLPTHQLKHKSSIRIYILVSLKTLIFGTKNAFMNCVICFCCKIPLPVCTFAMHNKVMFRIRVIDSYYTKNVQKYHCNCWNSCEILPLWIVCQMCAALGLCSTNFALSFFLRVKNPKPLAPANSPLLIATRVHFVLAKRLIKSNETSINFVSEHILAFSSSAASEWAKELLKWFQPQVEFV